MRAILTAIATVMLAAASAAARAAEDPAADAAGVEFYEKRVRPVLAENCYRCHGPDRQRGGLMLDSVATILAGGDRGPAVVPGKPGESLLIEAIRYDGDDLRMPPRGKLADAEIADLVEWVRQGAPGPARGPPLARADDEFDLAARRRHWAYQPVAPVAPPDVKSGGWCRSPLDRFILARLETAGLSPAPPADRRALIRRVTFTLTGLPPTPAEIDAFLADGSHDAYERLVDRLLDSPHYGERWARHWLDLVRYGETLGFEFDYDLYNAWRYRDYVIRAFNADLPYDQFVVEHLAGDLLPEPRRQLTGGNESILATGFFWMCEGKQTPVDIRQEQAEVIENQIDVLGKAFLAQTIACARCHDQKFDAISTRDYYALAGYLKSSRYQQAFLDPPERITALARRLAKIKARVRDRVAVELAPAWRAMAAEAGRYSLAARDAARDGEDAHVSDLAERGGLDAARLGRWVQALRQEATQATDHPLHAWAQLACLPVADSDEYQQRRTALRAALGDEQEQAATSTTSAVLLEDFRQPTFGDWYVTGDAFHGGPARPGDFVVGDDLQRPVTRFIAGGAHSGLLSDRLEGELRSQTFTIDKPYLHLRVAGRNARVNLVIDGYTLIMNPIYGGLTIASPGDTLDWQTMAVDRWIGRPAYLEISDSSIPPHRLNPPPSTARVAEGQENGCVALDRVLLSDSPDPPAAPNGINLEALDRSEQGGIDALAAAYQELMLREIDRWSAGQAASEPNDDGVALVNWMLDSGLLDADLAATRLAAPPSAESEHSLAGLLEEYRRIESSLPPPQRAPALADGTGEDEFVFIRGSYRTPGERARRRAPEVLVDDDWPKHVEGSGRLELARRLAEPTNPLLARVLVNRLWHHHFGAGIVRTPDDFGRMGEPPTHPDLLDYLAAEFVRSGWSVKAMHRLILLSSTYRQSGPLAPRVDDTTHAAQIDPENRLWHRMPVRRLEAEAVRDALLVVSGQLNRTMHGPSVLPYLTPHMVGRGKPSSGPLDGEGRRSIYINARRNFLTPMLVAFDYPALFSPVGRRSVSTNPAQALTLMNDPLVIQQAAAWAERVCEAEPAADRRIDALYLQAFGRRPTDDERREALAFVEQQGRRYGQAADDLRAWTDLCHVLFNVKEFVFVE